MTSQEQQLLHSLIERVNRTQLQEKDLDAEDLLARQLGNNPDALYILAQTVLVQDIALQQARAQVAQAQRPQPARTTSFLGSLLGHRDPDPPQTAYAPPPAVYAQPQYVAAPAGQPSFLRGAMQTAAGVAAGALAFEGVEAVLHGLGGYGHPGMGWGGSGMGWEPGIGAGFDRPAEETVIQNNYFDEPGDQGHRASGELHREDRSDAQFSDASYDDTGNRDDFADTSSLDSGRDSDNFDAGQDAGGFDDGGDFGSDGGNDLL